MVRQSSRDRTRRIPIVRSFCVLGVVWLCWHFMGRADRTMHHEPVSPSTDAPAAYSEPAGRLGKLQTYVVRPGDTFQGILAGFGVGNGEAIGFYRNLASLGLSAIFPGDSMVVAVGSDERLNGFSLLNRLQCWYHLHRDSMALTIEKQPIPTVRYRCVVKGTLSTCLSQDMFEYGVGDALVGKLADIFAWDINFFMDPRKGDRFEVVFEKFYREGRFVGYGDILAARYVNKGVAIHAIAFDDDEGDIAYYDLKGKSVQKQFLKAPLKYRRVSSGFSYRRKHPILGIVRPHLGIDYAAPVGTPVYAAADGEVRFAGRNGGYGRFVRIAHGGAYQTCYGHLHRIRRGIGRGTRVKQGELIGTVGSSGLSTGPHLDYRMKRHGQFVNPLTIKLPSKEGIPERDRDRFAGTRNEYLLILSKRFPEDGYYVLDMETMPAADTAMTRISIISEKHRDYPAGT
ncbi:MAG: peptidoglycan DD-metalloendopeptidase family protein [Chitinivibrionales bacterium]|nr:peptidoglycan DD-metalloendopeptidase family protein [Chitinivibrionales bacterium]MBD3396845.1 peptidoglycan DD-metalloendopeptidase family protein [Chitinivibrionales bacterium]